MNPSWLKLFLLERLGSNWKDHELLHGQLVACVRSSIYHIEGLKEGGNKEARRRGQRK